MITIKVKELCHYISCYISRTDRNTKTDCSTLSSTWTHVQTEPSLPVQHGEVVSLRCPVGKTLDGADTATCKDGTLDSEIDPYCSEGKSNLIIIKLGGGRDLSGDTELWSVCR